MANKFHKDLVGNDLHIGKSNVGSATPVGNQSAGVIGEFFWDSTNNKLYIAEATGTGNWVHSGAEFDEFIELTDTPTTFTGQGSKILRVNSGATAVEFTDSLILNGTTGSTSLDLTSTNGALRLNRLDNTQRNALTPLAGMTIFNTNTLQVEDYNGTAWVGASELDEWTELSDTPSSITANLVVQGNSGGTALEFGQALKTTSSPTFGNLTVAGNLIVDGKTTSINTDKVNISDNHLYMNAGYTTLSAQTGGLVVNYLPTASSTTVSSGAFVAGVASTSNPTVATVGAATFGAGSLVQISGTSNNQNDGLFEVLTHASNVLTIRGVGTTATVEDFTDNQFVANASDNAAITQVNVSVVRAGTDGAWESASGSDTGFSFSDLLTSTSGVNKTGTPVNNQLAVWTSSDTIEGDANLTYDGTALSINHTGASTVLAVKGNNSGGNVLATFRNELLDTSFATEIYFGHLPQQKDQAEFKFLLVGQNNPGNTLSFGFHSVTDVLKMTAGRVVTVTGTFGVSGTLSVGGSATITGDLIVNGTTTTINSTTLTVDDKNIELGTVSSPTDITADGGGITLKGTTDKTLIWDNANDNWSFNQSVNISTGLDYKINNVSVLNATTLGSSVVGSSLTSVGTLTSLAVTGTFKDSSGDVGTSGQILSSTVTGTNWITATGGTVTSTGTLTNNSLVRGNGGVDIDVGNITMSTDGNDLFAPGVFGVGTTTVLGKAHIKTSGTASSTTSFANELTLENAGDVGQTMIAGDSSNAHLVFRNQADTSSSIIRYRASGESLTFDVGAAGTLLSILGSGSLAYNGDALAINSSKNTGFGTTSPLAKVNALSTTEQLRLSFDVSNFVSFTTSSSGDLTVKPSGDSTIFQNTVNSTTGLQILNAAGTPLITVDTINKKTGFGTIFPDVEIHVDGAVYADSFQSPFGGSGLLQNFLANSERLAVTWTTPFSATVVSNVATAPNGETTADTVDWNTSTSTIGLRQSGMGTTISNTYTVSFWASTDDVTNKSLTFDLRSGTGVAVAIDSTLRRYSATVVAGSGSDNLDISNVISGSKFVLWGLQLVDGSEPKPYIRTLSSTHIANDVSGYSLLDTVLVDDILSPSDISLSIKGGSSTVSGTSPASLNLSSGNGLGSSSGGTTSLKTGNGGITGNGGTLAIFAGSGGATSGNGGKVDIGGGASPGTGSVGDVILQESTGGKVGIGTSTLVAKATILSTTEQLRLSYDATKFTSFTVDSNGDLAINPSGGDTTLTGNVDVTGLLVRQKWKEPVVAASTIPEDITSSFQNGSTIDFVTLVTGDRILIQHQTIASQNGIYTVNASGQPTRAFDFNDNSEVLGSAVRVVGGNIYAGVSFKLANTTEPTIGTTSLVFRDLKDTSLLRNVHVPADLGFLTTAPDNTNRVLLVGLTKYIFHRSMLIPPIQLPKVTGSIPFPTVNFESANSGVTLSTNSDADPRAYIWGRNIGEFTIKDLTFLDIGNGGVGKVTQLFDIVGSASISFFLLDNSVIVKYKKIGSIVNMIQIISGSLVSNNLRGFVNRTSLSNQSHRVIGFRTQITDAVATQRPMLTYQGSPVATAINSSQFFLNSGDDIIELDSALSSDVEIVGNSYVGTSKGNFFTASKAVSITAQADVGEDFVSVATGVGGSAITFAGVTDFVVGQVVLIKGATSTTYDGLHPIIAVSDDQKVFTIAVTFVATDTGEFQMVRHTVASHEFSRDGTVTISNAPDYNETLKILRETDTTIVLPQKFTVDRNQGTATSNPQDEDTIGVRALSNGAQKDSRAIGSFKALGNSTATVISTVDVWVDLNLNASATAALNISRHTLTNTTTGELRYDDLPPINGNVVASISASSSGGSQEFEFRVVVNGSPLSDAIVASVEIGGDTIAVPLIVPLARVQNDLTRIQVRNIDGTSNIIIKNITAEIE